MKKLLGNSIVFTISNKIMQAITFLLLPLYSNIISTSEYGIISNINTIIMLCNYIVTLCIDCVITRYYFDCVNEEEVKQLFSKISYFMTIVSILGYGLILVSAGFFCRNLDKSIYIAFVMAVISRVFDNYYALIHEYLVARQDGKTVSVITVLFGTLNLLSTYVCVMTISNKVIAYVLSFLIVSIIRGIVYVLYARKLLVPVKNFSKMKTYVHYSSSLLPILLSYWVLNTSDRLIITAISGTSAAGIYSMGSNFGHIVCIFIDSVNKAYKPYIFSLMNNGWEKTHEIIDKLSGIFVLMVTVLSSGVIVFIPSLISLLSKDYADSKYTAIILTCAMFFYGIMRAYDSVCSYYLKGVSRKAKVTWFCTFLNIALNIIFVHFIGVEGAALTTMFCYAIMCIYVHVIASSMWRLTTDRKKEIILYIISMIYIGSILLPVTWKGMAIKIMESLIYIFIVLSLYFKKELKILFRKMINRK